MEFCKFGNAVDSLCSVSGQDLDILKLVSDRIERGGGW